MGNLCSKESQIYGIQYIPKKKLINIILKYRR